MKVEVLDDDRIIVYYSMIIDDIDNYSTLDIKTFIKCLILRLRKKYHFNLHGYYYLDVYINKIMILDFQMIDEYDDEIDLNIRIHLNSDIMVKFDDYFLIDGDKYYYLNSYYMDISLVDVSKYIEFIDFIFLDDVRKVKNEGIKIWYLCTVKVIM